MRFLKIISLILGWCLLLLGGWQATVQRDEPVVAGIIFSSDRDGDYDLYRMRLDGSEQQKLTPSPGDDRNPTISPDGQWIVFDARRDGHEIYRMGLDGSEPQNLTQLPEHPCCPAISPDGQWIVFRSGQYEDWELYRMRLDGSEQQRLTHSPGDDCCAAFLQAHFSYDPRWLLLIAGVMIMWPILWRRG